MSTIPIKSIEFSSGDEFQTPSGVFHILDELGQGGFATVYRANLQGKEVALKIVKMWNIMPHDRKEYAFRLEQEYKISKKFNSSHIIRMYDFDELNGNPYVTMELCSGGSLRDKIDQNNQLHTERVAIEILKGLGDLHKEGIVHRDIKPENILFGSTSDVKLVDFGISGAIRNRVTKPNIFGAVKEVFATVAYSPPEQTDPLKAFKSLAPALDIYAFGITMYEFFTGGQLPFGSFEKFQNDLARYNRIKKSNEWDRDQLVQSIGDSPWVPIIEKCIKAKPSDRFNSTDEILNLLDSNRAKELAKNDHKDEKRYSNWILEIKQGDEIGRKYYLNILAINFQTNILNLGWLDLDHPLENHIGIVEMYTNYISGNHATLSFQEKSGRWFIQDGQDVGGGKWKNSKNGVVHNGVPIADRTQILQVEDILSIGFTTLKVTAI